MYKKHSLSDFLIAFLSSGHSSYRFHQILREREMRNFKTENIRLALSRLKSKGYIGNSKNGWFMTIEGFAKSKQKYSTAYISSPFNKESKNKNIIAFDIPEKERSKRYWLRNQLKIFGYKMLQQSLWVGPGPLPKEFLERLTYFKIRDNIKILSISSLNK